MREACDRGYRCLLIEDATESYFPAFKQATLAMIVAQGGIVGRTASPGRAGISPEYPVVSRSAWNNQGVGL